MTVTTLQVILASQSPRRRELLSLIGIEHIVKPAYVDESVLAGESPAEHCNRLALEKVAVLAAQHPHDVVIGADTIVLCNGEILGKPTSETDASAMLGKLSGRTHTVLSAVAASFRGQTRSAVETVSVTFLPLSADTIRNYVETGEPMDKAGAYGIQGFGATNIKRIDGDYFAVMGLPLTRMISLLRELGVAYNYGPLTLRRAD